MLACRLSMLLKRSQDLSQSFVKIPIHIYNTQHSQSNNLDFGFKDHPNFQKNITIN